MAQVRIQQAVEQMLAGFAAGGEAAGIVGTGSETALYGFADRRVFLLDAIAGVDAREVSTACGFGNVGEVEVKDDVGAINAAGNDKIRVHSAFVAINHEIGVDPVVEGVATCCDRTGLQAKTLARFDLVIGVIENAVEILVKLRHMVATVEIVVDKNFPVASEGVVPAF